MHIQLLLSETTFSLVFCLAMYYSFFRSKLKYPLMVEKFPVSHLYLIYQSYIHISPS